MPGPLDESSTRGQEGDSWPYRVKDVAARKPDIAGLVIEMVFAKRTDYAVYLADSRVLVQYSDDPKTADAQIQSVGSLLCLRRQLEYLTVGLRSLGYYNRQLANALQMALEKSTDIAKQVLISAITDATDERARIGRQYYLMGAGAVAMTTAVALITAGGLARGGSAATGLLWLSGGGGAVGALLSIAVGIRSRTVAPDHDWATNLVDGVLRVGIGIIAGFALHLILTTGFLNMVAAGTVAIKGTAGWKGALLVGFAAGFLERLVPDLLEKQQGSDSTQKSKTTDPNHVALANALTPPIAP